MIRRLYKEVVARHPRGLLHDKDKEIFEPFLSKDLLRRINLARDCEADWFRQHPNNSDLKPPDWGAKGLFSGGEAEAEPSDFHVDKTEAEKNGSFRTVVKLKWLEPPDEPSIWRVALIVKNENGHYVIDDVIYLHEPEVHLSEILSDGCDGPRWVGLGDKRFR
jgi:hypothetical protein